jgi:hypothetical protein
LEEVTASGLGYSPAMGVPENNTDTDPFNVFKRAALISLLWGCAGSFLLGVVVGLLLSS